MNFKQLRAFREVMQSGSISEAARRLHRTQPAISSLLCGLENQLGIKLFTRQGMRLHPVPEAYFLLQEANKILTSLEQSKRTMQSIRNLEHGSLSIVCMPGPSVFFMPDLIDSFLKKRSSVKVSLITKSSGNIERLISAQQYDLGFADMNLISESNSNLITYERISIPCLCALNYQDPLCGKSEITARDLDNKPMAALYEDHSTRQQTETAFINANANFNICFQAQYFVPLLTFVERGRACAVVDALSAMSYRLYRQQDPAIKFRPFIPNIELNTAIMMPSQRPASMLATEFQKLIRTRLQTLINDQTLDA